MIEPSVKLQQSAERQTERYSHVRYWNETDNKSVTPGWEHEPGWYAFCCSGCHGCGGVPISNKHLRPIDAHLARLEWLDEIPVGPTRVVS